MIKEDYLTLILTYRCKENCHFCFIEKKDISLKRETAKRVVDLFLNREGEVKTIKFFGGEPLLEFSLLKDIVYYCENKLKILNKRANFVLPTSGTLLNERTLNFIKLHKIELVLDSRHLKKIKKRVINKIFSLPFLTLTINISPSSSINLFAQFKAFYNQGFNTFNLLPLYYISWPKKSIAALKEQFEKIKNFYQRYPGIYFKNVDLNGDIPLFNTCLTCDVSGDLYSSNMIIFKTLSKFKKDFSLGNIDKFKKGKEFASPDKKSFSAAISKSFPKKILNNTFTLDKVLNAFVDSLQRPIKNADIKLGDTCNNHCKFCVRRKAGQQSLNKNTEEIKKNLQEARGECEGIVLTGGEPTIRRDLLELVSFAKRLGYKAIQVQTNGRMLAYKDFCQRLIQAGANGFGIAIHGHIPQAHDYLTSSKGSFYQSVKAIKNLKELSQPVVTNTVIVKSNYRHLPQIAQLLVDLGIRQFQFAFVHALGSAGDNFDSIVPRISMVMPYVKKGLDIGIEAGVRVMTEAIPYCLMDKYEDYIAERIIPSTKIYESSNEVIDFDKIRPTLAKAKCKDCEKCRFFYICEGTWREYPERFGWSEFKPVL